MAYRLFEPIRFDAAKSFPKPVFDWSCSDAEYATNFSLRNRYDAPSKEEKEAPRKRDGQVWVKDPRDKDGGYWRHEHEVISEIATSSHGHYPMTKETVHPLAEKSSTNFWPVIKPKQGQERGWVAMEKGEAPKQVPLDKMASPGTTGQRIYKNTGPLSIAVDRGGSKATGKIVLDPSKSTPSEGGGIHWAANLYGKSGKWDWVAGERDTALTKINKNSDKMTPALISVSENLSGKHFYALHYHTGESTSRINYWNHYHTAEEKLKGKKDKNEPRNAVSAQGQLVLGKPVGVIRNNNGHHHPVYDVIHVKPKKKKTEPNVVRTFDTST